MKASGAHINERENGAAFGRNKLARGLKCGGAAKGQRRSLCVCVCVWPLKTVYHRLGEKAALT